MPRPVDSLPYVLEGEVNSVSDPRKSKDKENKPGRWYCEVQFNHRQENGRIALVDAVVFGGASGEDRPTLVQGEQGIASGSVVLNKDLDGVVQGLKVLIFNWHSIGSPAKMNGAVGQAQTVAASAGRR